jgi:hypothetical protein
MASVAALASIVPDLTNLATDRENVGTTALTKVSVSQQRNTGITLTTAEGDTVTFTSSSEFEASLSSYDYRGSLSGETLHMLIRSFDYSASRDFFISVDGDLNPQELRDIRKAMRQINRIMRSFLAGDLDRAMNKVLKLGNLESIASLEASLQFSRSVSIVQQAAVEKAPGRNDSGESGSSPELITHTTVKNLVHQTMHIVNHSGIDSARLMRPLDGMFSHYSKELSNEGHRAAPKLKLLSLIKSDILNRLASEDSQHIRHGRSALR